MTREHDPPHIRLYDWPNVPQRATELADSLDIDHIVGVAVVDADMTRCNYLIGHDHTELVVDDDGIGYCFIH